MYTDKNGLFYDFRSYDTSTSLGLNGNGDLYIYDENRNLIAKIADFNRFSNKLGLTFSSTTNYLNSGFADIEVPNEYGSTFDVISSTGSKTGQKIAGIKTGALNDHFLGDYADESIDLGADNDYAHGGQGNDYLVGGDGDDVLTGGYKTGTAEEAANDNDILVGGAGNDLISGGIGNDVIICGERTDEALTNGAGHDWVLGGEGNDLIHGSCANDFLNGGAGADYISGGLALLSG